MEHIVLQNGASELKIALKGAEPVGLMHAGKPILWEKNTAHWNRVAPHLFPIVGKLKEDRYTCSSGAFSMSQHGFARDAVFTVTRNEPHNVILTLTDNDETRLHYPYAFRFEVEYLLEPGRLTIVYHTHNTGYDTLPFSVGGHPAFALNDPLDQYELHFPDTFHADRWLLSEGLFNGTTDQMEIPGKLPLHNDLFAQDAIVWIAPPFNRISLRHQHLGTVVTMESTQWEALGIWTKAGAPFLCIEPWWGYADFASHNGDLLTKKGIHLLEPEESQSVSYTLLFS